MFIPYLTALPTLVRTPIVERADLTVEMRQADGQVSTGLAGYTAFRQFIRLKDLVPLRHVTDILLALALPTPWMSPPVERPQPLGALPLFRRPNGDPLMPGQAVRFRRPDVSGFDLLGIVLDACLRTVPLDSVDSVAARCL